jgi:hypothetical protein
MGRLLGVYGLLLKSMASALREECRPNEAEPQAMMSPVYLCQDGGNKCEEIARL